MRRPVDRSPIRSLAVGLACSAVALGLTGCATSDDGPNETSGAPGDPRFRVQDSTHSPDYKLADGGVTAGPDGASLRVSLAVSNANNQVVAPVATLLFEGDVTVSCRPQQEVVLSGVRVVVHMPCDRALPEGSADVVINDDFNR